MAAMRTRGWAAFVALAGVLFLTGCLTPRQEALLRRMPRNQVLTPDSTLAPLGEGESYVFGEFERTRDHNVCLLRLARDFELTKRFHAEHDLILVCVSGSAIVTVEEARYVATPGTTVVLPNLTAYSVLPNDPGRDFAAAMIFSPPFDGKDTFLED
jgi:quercetin dioxygenase-like cupin family protein